MKLGIKFQHSKRILALTLAFATALSVSVSASPVYKDVPTSHWAYSSISAVADRGLIIGDTSANFKPNDLLDKFETSKILARAAGYKYGNLSADEQDYYNKCYDKNKTFLSQFSAKFTRWNTSADREIAFLLEKEILTTSDLNQFVIIKDGKEQLRALSRGECAVFVTKLIGKNSQANLDAISHDYPDDAKIPTEIKKYAYLLKSMGIITGDTGGNFVYDGAITRASMAVILDRALGLTAMPQATAAPVVQPGGVSTVSTISGAIDNVYASLRAIQIVSQSGSKEIVKLSSNSTVYVDGYLKTINDLQAGMSFSGTVSNGELVDLRAQSGGISNISPSNPQSTPAPSQNVQYSTVDGTVATVEQTAASRTIGIEIKRVNPRDGSIVTEVKNYTLAGDCKISRGETAASFSEVGKGDIITAEVSGSTVYSIILEQRSLVLKDASLVEKKYNETSGVVTLAIQDSKGKSYDLRIASSTVISRKNIGITSWDNLRIGDVVDVAAEYGVIQSITAYGVISTIDGWIEEIHIGKTLSYMNLLGTDSKIKKYYIILSSTDVYSLRVGNKVRLRLDSQEVSTVMLLEEASTNIVTGYVQSISGGTLTLRDTQPYGTNGRRDLLLDSTTVYTNSKTGEKVSYSALREGQKVYVVCQSSFNNIVKTLTILSD